MQDLTPNVSIQQNALGLYTGIIQTGEGKILIDSPYRSDGHKTWSERSAKSGALFVVLLDTHYDRMLSAKGCDCVIVAQADCMQPVKPRQQAVKRQEELLGSGDVHEQSGASTHSFMPEISFENNLGLHLGGVDLMLEHHPGSSVAGTWAILPNEKVIFIGDSVMVDQPPFLAYSNPACWAQDLKLLGSRAFKGYQIVSSRHGLVTQDQVRTMGKLINFIHSSLAILNEKRSEVDAYLELIPRILKRMDYPSSESDQFYNRLRWGLTTYYEVNQS